MGRGKRNKDEGSERKGRLHHANAGLVGCVSSSSVLHPLSHRPAVWYDTTMPPLLPPTNDECCQNVHACAAHARSLKALQIGAHARPYPRVGWAAMVGALLLLTPPLVLLVLPFNSSRLRYRQVATPSASASSYTLPPYPPAIVLPAAALPSESVAETAI